MKRIRDSQASTSTKQIRQTPIRRPMVGDVVQLKSGGIKMTVCRPPDSLMPDNVEVVYSHYDTLRRDAVPLAAIRIAPPDDEEIPF